MIFLISNYDLNYNQASNLINKYHISIEHFLEDYLVHGSNLVPESMADEIIQAEEERDIISKEIKDNEYQ